MVPGNGTSHQGLLPQIESHQGLLLSKPLRFVLIERPKDKQNANVRKRIRSHVTAVQHGRARQRHFHKLLPNAVSTDATIIDQIELTPCKIRPIGPPLSKDQSVCDENEDCSSAPPPLVRRFSTGADAFRLFMLHDPGNLIGSSFTALNTDVMAILVSLTHAVTSLGLGDLIHNYHLQGHYANFVTIDDKYIVPTSRGVFQAGGVVEWYIPYVHSDPALLAAAVLIGAGHRLYSCSDTKYSVPFLRLREFVIAALGEALETPSRALSDQIIVAVVILATFEVLWGFIDSFEVHMAGAARMIELRRANGEAEIEGPVRCILEWLDAQTSNVAGMFRGRDRRMRLYASAGDIQGDVDLFTLGAYTKSLWVNDNGELEE